MAAVDVDAGMESASTDNGHGGGAPQKMPLWVQSQIKAFTGWMNSHLAARGMKVDHILGDLADGVLLIHTLEVLEKGYKFKHANLHPKNKYARLENVNQVLELVSRVTSRPLVGINSTAIVQDQNIKSTLGLLWHLILHYAISSGDAGEKSTEGPTAALLKWCNERLPETQKVSNFTKDFSSGMSFALLMEAIKPGHLDVQELLTKPAVEVLQTTFDSAENNMNIPQLLDPHLVASEPDAQSIMTYIAFLKQFEELNASIERPPKDWKEQLADLKARLQAEEEAHKVTKTTLADNQSHAHTLAADLESIRSRFSDAEAHLAQHVLDKRSLEEQLSVVTGRLHETQASLDHAQSQLSNTAAELEASRAQMSDDMQQAVDNFQAKIQQMQEELNSIKKQLRDTQERLRLAEEHGKSLEAGNARLQGALDDARRHAEEVAAQRAADIAEANRKLEELSTQLRATVDELKDNKQLLAAEVDKRISLQEANNHLTRQLEQVQTEFDDLEEEHGEVCNRLQSVQAENATLQQTLQEEREQFEESAEDNSKHLWRLKEQHKDTASELELLKKELQKTKDTLKVIEKQKSIAGHNVLKLNGQLKSTRDKAREHIEKLNQRLQLAQKAGRELQVRLAGMKDSDAAASESVGMIQQELDEMANKNYDLERKLDNASQQLDKYRDDWDEEKSGLLWQIDTLRGDLARAQQRPMMSDSSTQTKEKKQPKEKKPPTPPPEPEVKPEWDDEHYPWEAVKCWARKADIRKTKFGATKNCVMWKFITPADQCHLVVLEHSLMSGKRKVMVDGVVLLNKTKRLMDSGSSHQLSIEGTMLNVIIRKRDQAFGYDLRVNGVPFGDAVQDAIRNGETRVFVKTGGQSGSRDWL